MTSKYPPLSVSNALTTLFSQEESARLRASTAHKTLGDYTQEEFVWLLSRYEVGDICLSQQEVDDFFSYFNIVADRSSSEVE